MKTINGYQLTSELKPDKSGYAKWGFAKKEGKEYFIKEFLSPVYPEDETILSPAQIKSKRDICSQFYSKKRYFYSELNRCLNGSIVAISDFFRFKSHFYVVTEKINAINFTPTQIARLPLNQKILIAKVILHSLAMLHRHKIVHADLKADNILFKKTPLGIHTAKLIDFDSSFFEKDPPSPDGDFQGDMVYFAPESFLYIAEETGSPDCKIDIFAMGVLLHQYFSGSIPVFDKSKYTYTFEAVLDGGTVSTSGIIPHFVAGIITKMLSRNPKDRPDAESCFNYFQYYTANSDAQIEDIEGDMNFKVNRETEKPVFEIKTNELEMPKKTFSPLEGDVGFDSLSDSNGNGIRNVSVHISKTGLKSTMKNNRID